MGMSVKKSGQQTEINVTPLVDVVLVLLIIFMVVAPLLAANIPIRIPEQVDDNVPVEAQPDNQQIVLQLRCKPPAPPGGTCTEAQVVITINDQEVQQKDVGAQLQTFYAKRRDKILFFDAEDGVPYGATVDVMDIVRDQGLILGVVPNAIENN
jgi:biopolymer transport protein ExbD